MSNYPAVERALRTAAPHALLDAARGALTEHCAAEEVRLLLADYSVRVLQPVTVPPHLEPPLPVHGTAQGRAFGSQEPQFQRVRDDAVDLHLPVTVRGDRLGVLTVRLPRARADDEAVHGLTTVAEQLGREIIVAERDTDVYLQARRAGRLTLAAEMQWQLLPGRSCAREQYTIGAQLEPAYAIRGDNFDWATTDETLTVTISNGMGEGIEAALLTNLAVNALRNARRAGVGIADQASLADQAVYARYRGEQYVSTLLLCFTYATGQVQIVDAGSPHLWRQRGKAEGRATLVERIELEARLPLGMFEESAYRPQSFQVEPGDRLLFVSDGVHAACSANGESYGERALARAITSTRLLPAADVPGAILRELATYLDADPEDDALIVCLDWKGGPPR